MPVCRGSGTSNTQAAERGNMSLRRLNEEIILQALLDLSHPAYREEVLHFFTGERFGICAAMECMDPDEARKILEIARLMGGNSTYPNQRNRKTKRVNTTTGMIPGGDSNRLKSNTTLDDGAHITYMSRQEALS